MKFWLLALTRNQVLRLAMLKTILRKEKKRNNNSSSKPQHKLPQQTLASEIINPTALPSVFFLQTKKEQCISVPDVMWACAWCLISKNIT